ncbi:tyrosine-type recombinase/integrase [Cereibacter sediminicola]|uniref:tyrosine-type recombinase/integrase n=1 Tax=Cereibacter sediminicola TaxID=2584941 RepID=UPI001FEBF084|nr:tyrosine-type recombinase/integrase [Cereibacter sediminicola]
MMRPASLPAPTVPSLSAADEAALTDLFIRGTPANTLRAYERDLIYLAAWKQEAFGQPLVWPESEAVALRFVTDHARDLGLAAADDPGRRVAEALVAAGLRRSLDCPAPATLDRRIASWQTFHRMRNLVSPFEAPLVRQARAKARRAAARPRRPKSARPITRPLLDQLLATCDSTMRGLRDRAILSLGFASGGRRRSEITALRIEDIGTDDFAGQGTLWLRLLETKTTAKGTAPRLVLKGRAARAVMGWMLALGAEEGPLFRPISKAGRPLARGLAPDAIRTILVHRLALAGLPPDHASPHGLRSGFLTQAALDGAPIQAAMRLSLHRSVAQAQRYYDDVEITGNPATDLLG